MDSSASLQNTLGHDNSQGEEETVDPRRCSHLKGDGSRCKAWKVKGEPYCAGHLGLGKLDAKGAAAVSAKARQRTAEVRPKTYKQALQAAWEQHAERIVARRLDIIDNGSDADALRAIEAMESRIYGKPKETVEQVTTPRTVEALSAMTPEERRQLLIQLEAEGRMPVLRAVEH